MRKLFILTLIVVLMGSFLSSRTNAQADPRLKIDSQVQAALDSMQSGELTTVIVTLAQQADVRQVRGANRAARQQGIIRALQSNAEVEQRPLRALLQTRRLQRAAGTVTPFWIFNGMSVTATADVIRELAARSDVAKISPDTIAIVPTSLLAAGPPETNLAAIHAPDLWNLGFSGQGVVVANMDSGVDVSHPDLATRWRGGSNSWFDPYGQHATPIDLSGHGTWTMGVMVAGDAGGTSLGVAPQAQWIAVKIFNDAGSATATAVHQGFQWLLDPDGNPNTADAPQVVNNSWAFGAPGCNLEFQLDLQALSAAGILPIFAAGNYGPGASTGVSPANNPEAFAVGAVDNTDQIYAASSRGPSACGETSTIYPELTAPGVNINTTDLFGFYSQQSGTSLSAPHAAGALALLLSAYPNLTTYQQQQALINGAVDLGTAGPDNVFGYGRLDALAAYQWLQEGGSSVTPTPAPPTSTSMPTSTPTATSTSTSTATPTASSTATSTPTATPTPTSTPRRVTATATPTRTPTRTSTPTSTPAATTTPGATLHVGDLDRAATLSGAKWNALVTITIHDNTEGLAASVTVNGTWSNGAVGTASCVTNSSGVCQVSKTGLNTKTSRVTFTVTSVTKATFTYQSSANHDPDGDSTGTSITALKP